MGFGGGFFFVLFLGHLSETECNLSKCPFLFIRFFFIAVLDFLHQLGL